MPRQAREKKLYSFYRIRQVCRSIEDLLAEDQDRMILIQALLSAKEKHNFKLLGLSIHSQGYEMVLYDNGSDITKIMRSVNISFAMKYKCLHEEAHHVFQERYQSDLLDWDQVEAHLKQMEPCQFTDPTWLDALDFEACQEGKCIDCKREARRRLDRDLEGLGISYEALLKNKKQRNEMIKSIRKNSTLSLQEIGDLFGGLSESAVCKILTR